MTDNHAKLNASKAKRRKTSIHVALSKDCKAKVVADAATSVRKPGQQIEYILEIYYSIKDDPNFEALIKANC